MTKKGNGKKASGKTTKLPVEHRETLQTWGLHPSQMAILAQAQERHKEELLPLKNYQQNQLLSFLSDIANELGIPKDVKARFDGSKFIEVKPDPQPSPTTQDLTKLPA